VSDHENQATSPVNISATLGGMQKLLLEALRHREQEIFRYLVILGPALGGFVWLLHSAPQETLLLTAGTMGVQLLLLLGTIYSLALGYNYRYIVLQLAKLEFFLEVTEVMLAGWPRSRKNFLDRYKLLSKIPWCTPPEIIKLFWWAFLVGIAFVTVTACMAQDRPFKLWFVLPTGMVCLLTGFTLPIWFGFKLRMLCNKEPESWDRAVLSKSMSVSTIFGHPEEARIFSETYSVFLERLPKLSDTLNRVFDRTFDSRGPADGVVYHLGRLCVEDFGEILLLCENGYGNGGQKLLRGLYERAVTMAYIAKNPNEAEAFIGYTPIHERKELSHAKNAGFDVTKHMSSSDIEDIETRFESVKGRYEETLCEKCGTKRLQSSWSRLDIASMAKKVHDDLSRLYWMCYFEPTLHGHATLYSILKSVKRGDSVGEAIFNESAQREKVNIALFCAHTLILFTLDVQNQFFGLKFDEELKARLADFTACWNDGPPLKMVL
jgi:hypothetical protein